MNFIVTPFLIIVNLVVFVFMISSGVSFIEPTIQQILDWGGSSSLSTILKGEWWRLITCMFVHIGIIHLLMNMYILFDIGSHLEPVIGKLRFITVYLATGIFGGLMSQIWYARANTVVVEAGASGAVFGIIGVFFALLTTHLFTQEIQMALLKRVGILIVVNIFYGMQSQVNMAAHLGGLFSGMILGYGLYFTLIYHRYEKILKPASICLTVLITTLCLFSVLKSIKKSDFLQLHEIMNEYVVLENSIHELVGKIPPYPAIALQYFQSNILPKWEQALLLSQRAKLLHLTNGKYRDYLVEWISLNYEKACLVAGLTDQNVSKTNEKIDSIIERLKKLNENIPLET